MADLIVRAADIMAVLEGICYWNYQAAITVRFNSNMVNDVASYHEVIINDLGPNPGELNEFCGAIVECFNDAVVLASAVKYQQIKDLLEFNHNGHIQYTVTEFGNIIDLDTGEVLKTHLKVIER